MPGHAKADARFRRTVNALDVDLAVLVGKPTVLDGVPDAGGLLALRRALTPIGSPTTPGADVSGDLADAWRLYWRGRCGL